MYKIIANCKGKVKLFALTACIFALFMVYYKGINGDNRYAATTQKNASV